MFIFKENKYRYKFLKSILQKNKKINSYFQKYLKYNSDSRKYYNEIVQKGGNVYKLTDDELIKLESKIKSILISIFNYEIAEKIYKEFKEHDLTNSNNYLENISEDEFISILINKTYNNK